MVVKSQLKRIKSLHQKKNRKQEGLFFVEGEKGIADAISNQLTPYLLLCSKPPTAPQLSGIGFEKVTQKEMDQISALKNSNGFLGVFEMPELPPLNFKDWILVLDQLQDPGNLGTIIRLCDWFGIQQILCSPETVDVFNPKVVQASMGSIGRIGVYYQDLLPVFNTHQLPIYGTFMEGTPIQNITFNAPGFLVLGNEGNGISKEISDLVTEKISIQAHSSSAAESLNVANAAAIVFHEIRR